MGILTAIKPAVLLLNIKKFQSVNFSLHCLFVTLLLFYQTQLNTFNFKFDIIFLLHFEQIQHLKYIYICLACSNSSYQINRERAETIRYIKVNITVLGYLATLQKNSSYPFSFLYTESIQYKHVIFMQASNSFIFIRFIRKFLYLLALKTPQGNESGV